MPELEQQTPSAAKAPARPSNEAFGELYRESRDDVYAYVAYLVADRSLAEEVTAQAFERAFTRRRSFDARRGELRGWLFRIARNAAIDELKRSKRETALEFAADELSDERDQTTAVERVFVAEAMRKLQPRDRELIALKFFAGLENAEIAKVVGQSKTNVGTQLHRAISKLRTEMTGATDA